ncbi:hypothetical protein [Streptomyces sp. RTGN2]|uniref:hypothetical protein n=1 Tax=Streptomyces sp. RTGN2 TaxID=3016525 RepID=UPI002555E101|nr:hypothetical protein [Streptomyces sp. RTGN2]
MIARLTEDATPDEVAGIIEEVNGALVGALPQLTELVATAADWTRLRLAFDVARHNPVFETWTRLAAAYGMLRDVQEQLEIAKDGVAARTDPRYHLAAARQVSPVAAKAGTGNPGARGNAPARSTTRSTAPLKPFRSIPQE